MEVHVCMNYSHFICPYEIWWNVAPFCCGGGLIDQVPNTGTSLHCCLKHAWLLVVIEPTGFCYLLGTLGKCYKSTRAIYARYHLNKLWLRWLLQYCRKETLSQFFYLYNFHSPSRWIAAWPMMMHLLSADPRMGSFSSGSWWMHLLLRLSEHIALWY